ncbi:MAG: DMT family transporter [Micrococcales bacterium]
MSRKALLLFLAVGLAWGVPYFFIRLAIGQEGQGFSAPTIVFARVVIGAAVLLPIAIRQGAMKAVWRHWPWVLAFALIEMAGPWFLITTAEQHITSGLAGLMIATVPFFAVPLAYFLGDKSVIHKKTIFGLVFGFLGVVLLVGIDTLAGHIDPIWVGALILSAIGYAVAPMMADVKLREVPTAGVMGTSMAIVAVIYAIPVSFELPKDLATNPPMSAWLALLGLGVICSALAFVLFFALVKEIGGARATLITYVNTAVALLLGVIFLGEPITPGMLVGFPMVVIGSYFASRRHD